MTEQKRVRRTTAEKLADNPKSLRLAVNANCEDCESGLGGGYRQIQYKIGNCPCTSCALHGVRPYQHLEGLVRNNA